MEQKQGAFSSRTRRFYAFWITVILLAFLAIVPLVMLRVQLARHGALVPSAQTVQAATEKKVFESMLAGQWYDADKDKLTAEIDGYLAKADAPPLEHVQALIVPHAGYRYSGPIAAYGYKQVAGKRFSRVVVMGPSHRLPMEDVASVPDVTHYATPLGEVPLDTDFIAALTKHPQFKCIPGADTEEHSVQIQIPLLQRAVGDFKLVPIVVGQLDAETTRAMAKVLSSLIDADTLMVASSDFTHYGPNYGYQPFKDDVENNLKKLDMGAWECIQRKDPGAFAEYVRRTGDTICGRCPIGVLLAMLAPESEPHLLKYDTSGHIMGDTTNSVSYLAIAFTGAWKKGESVAASEEAGTTLTEEDKGQLLALARGTLEGYIKNGQAPTPDQLGIKITPGMSQIMGAFVTLTEKGELRGCIGEIVPMRALYKAVAEHAIDSGVNDNRFRPVTADELPLLHYEITAWPKAPQPVASYKDIVLGKHGIVLRKSGRTALFLPQVPGEQGWDIEQTLTHLSMKAGLPPDAWKEGASFSVFEGIIFSEKGK